MQDRVLTLHAAAKRLRVPERTLRYRASHGRIEGAFKQGKLWKFRFPALEIWAYKEKYVQDHNWNNPADHVGGSRTEELSARI